MHQAVLSNSTTASEIQRREQLRRIMRMAWDFRRGEPGRPFADCLRGAWKITKRLAETAAGWARKTAGSGGRLSSSLIRSPIRRSLTGERYAGASDYRAAYTTGRLGC